MQKAAIYYEELLKSFSYQNLSEIKAATNTDVYAVVVEVKPFKRILKGRKDYMASMTITDPSLNGQCITANFFNPKTDSLPHVSIGSILVLKEVNVNQFNNRAQLVNTSDTKYTAFDPETLEEKPSVDVSYAVKDYELDIIKALHAWNQKMLSVKMSQPQFIISKKRPILETAQLSHSSAHYFDYIGMIVDFHRQDAHSKVNLVLTDFTVNPKYYPNDKYIANNISSDILLQCTLWDNHANNCPKLNFGDYVYIENCTRKTKNQYLEIAVNGNKLKKKQLTLLEEHDPSLRDLLERKAEFLKSAKELRRENSSAPIHNKTHSIRTRLTCSRNFNTIKDILENEEVGLYLLRAFIVDYQPKDLNDWIRGWCSTCQKT
ncbi:MAG: hypothetical protein EXX96DRAFT_621094 [Benjaminiella poitrasii]|nr:MAG: hypothetical protein EXX96DRAFT_621094 [Benjaminiella poitrasii]